MAGFGASVLAFAVKFAVIAFTTCCTPVTRGIIAGPPAAFGLNNGFSVASGGVSVIRELCADRGSAQRPLTGTVGSLPSALLFAKEA